MSSPCLRALLPLAFAFAMSAAQIVHADTDDEWTAQFSSVASTFPGTVMVPRNDLEPFASLSLSTVTADGESYQLVWGESGGNSATVSATFAAVPGQVFDRCSASALYCRENILGRDDTAPGSEIFRGLNVNGMAASVTHITCCNGLYWIVDWSDPTQGVSYELELAQDVARPYGSRITGDKRQAAAVVELASALVPLEP